MRTNPCKVSLQAKQLPGTGFKCQCAIARLFVAQIFLRSHSQYGRSHGARAFHEIYFLERACQAQVKALSGGAELHYPSEEVCVKTAKQFASPLVEPILQRAWLAALSLIEHQQAEYSA